MTNSEIIIIIIIICAMMRDLLFRFHPNLVVPIDEDGTKNT